MALYAALVLAPLGLAWRVDPFDAPRPKAVDVSAALGFVGFAILTIQFALVSRLSSLSRLFGNDVLMQFHRDVALVAAAVVFAHPLMLAGAGVSGWMWSPFHGTPASRAGAVAVWTVAIVIVTSLYRRRLRLSYETWQIVHLAGACVIAGASLAHIAWIGRYAGAPALRWTLLAYALLFLVLAVRYRVVRPIRLARHPWEITANADLGGSTRLLSVRPAGHDGLLFAPGQFVWLLTGRSPLVAAQHPFSIASSAAPSSAGQLEFAIKALGDWSAGTVPALAAGTRVWIDGPYGGFTPSADARGGGLVLIAGGIGIAPMRSILLTLRDRTDRRPIVLFYAASDWSRVTFREELASLQNELRLSVVYVFERPAADWAGERGFITADMLTRHVPHPYAAHEYFVCGPIPMMDAIARILSGLGVSASHVHTERFQMV